MAILTGPKLREEIAAGNIEVTPYEPKLVGTNSIDLRLKPILRVYEDGYQMHNAWNDWWMGASNQFRLEGPPSPPTRSTAQKWPPAILDMMEDNPTEQIEISEHGIVLWPGILYLAATKERVGSNMYVPWFDGRSSIGRLGIHVHVTAGKGDTGWFGNVTLEIHVLHPVRIYANKKPICQASFFETVGDLEQYKGRYQDHSEPTASRIHLDEYDRI